MNIDWIIPCRFAEVHDGLATLVGAGFDAVWVQEVPSPVQVLLAVRLLALPEEIESSEPHSTATRIRRPNGELLSEQRGEMVIGGGTSSGDWLAGSIVLTAIRFEAGEAGAYMIELDVDDASKSLPLHVVVGQP